jgi:hypothetical protein
MAGTGARRRKLLGQHAVVCFQICSQQNINTIGNRSWLNGVLTRAAIVDFLNPLYLQETLTQQVLEKATQSPTTST